MDVNELAKLLDYDDYFGTKINLYKDEARKNGLVIVFGYSDDNMEFRGAIEDEVGCWNGGKAKITPNLKIFQEHVNKESLQYNRDHISRMPEIEAIWCPQDETGKVKCSWEFRAPFPHSTFRMIEDGRLYCIGIVFNKIQIPK